MNSNFSHILYNSVSELPKEWNEIAVENIFFQSNYLTVLENSAPKNMDCKFIGLYENSDLVGISIYQMLNVNQLESFGERDKCIKTSIRNTIFKNFCSHVLFIGNNMLSGQNAFIIKENINQENAINELYKAVDSLKEYYKKEGTKIHITTIKDFDNQEIKVFKNTKFEKQYKFSTQPNMIFTVREDWKNEQDYIDSFSKKYRDQYKRARKKAAGIEKRKLKLEEIIANEDKIYELYFNVAQNAPFNTFFLAKNHFSEFKKNLKDNFLFYGYFIENQLIGFNTLIKNGQVLDTYFLGYDDKYQRDKMLYLNMLYDMIGYSINKGYKKIIFGRTALEIKSSVGAKPEEMFGYISHTNPVLDKSLCKIFPFLEPKTVWTERNPFK